MGSASESCLTVCVAARERALDALSTPNTTVAERSQLLTKFVIYGTDQTHSLGAKAALVLGIRFRALPTTASDDWGLRGETLRAALEEDEAAGVIPFILLATFGTTSSGASESLAQCSRSITNTLTADNLLEITAVKKDYPNLFVHLDAAWSGVFLALPECRGDVLKALNGGGIDSFCTNVRFLQLLLLVFLSCNCSLSYH